MNIKKSVQILKSDKCPAFVKDRVFARVRRDSGRSIQTYVLQMSVIAAVTALMISMVFYDFSPPFTKYNKSQEIAALKTNVNGQITAIQKPETEIANDQPVTSVEELQLVLKYISLTLGEGTSKASEQLMTTAVPAVRKSFEKSAASLTPGSYNILKFQ